MNVIGSIGLLAPAGTPVEFIEQIAQATRTAVAEPAYQRLLIDAGIEPVLDSNPEKLRRTLPLTLLSGRRLSKSSDLRSTEVCRNLILPRNASDCRTMSCPCHSRQFGFRDCLVYPHCCRDV